jgi:hypothetical protein
VLEQHAIDAVVAAHRVPRLIIDAALEQQPLEVGQLIEDDLRGQGIGVDQPAQVGDGRPNRDPLDRRALNSRAHWLILAYK